MDEDLELNRFVREALEAREPFAWAPPRPSAFRVRWPWAASALLAASVALVAAFHAPVRAASSPVEDALRLLAEAEGVDLGAGETESSADLLLAWQEVSG